MKSRCFYFALCALLLLVVSGCGSKNTVSEQSESTDTQATAERDASEPLEAEEVISTAALETEAEDVTRFSWIGVGTNYLYRASDFFLQYYDFEQRTWLALCSSPNCDHTTATCGAYAGDSTWVDDVLPYDGDIYYLRCEDLNRVSVNCFSPTEQAHTVVCTLEDEAGSLSVNPTNCYIWDGTLIFEEQMVSDDSEEDISRIVQVDLKSGKVTYSALYLSGEQTLIGMYQDTLIGFGRSDPMDSPAYDAAAAEAFDGDLYEYLATLPVTCTLYTMQFGEDGAEWTSVWESGDGKDLLYSYKNPCYGRFFLYNIGAEAYTVDVLSGEERSLFSGDCELISQEAVIGNELFYIVLDELDEDGNAVNSTKCVLNLQTGENFRLGSANSEGNPFAATDAYFVQENVQAIAKVDYYSGSWDKWFPLE